MILLLLWGPLLLYIVLVSSINSSAAQAKAKAKANIKAKAVRRRGGILLCRLAALSIVLAIGLDLQLLWYGNWSAGMSFSVVLFDGQLVMDHQLVIFELLMLFVGLVLIASQLGEHYWNNPVAIILVIANIAGAILLISSKDWLVTAAAWELFNLALYLLAGALGLQYFMLSAFATTIFLLGIALIYAFTGTTNLTTYYWLVITEGISSYLILAAILAKLGSAPLHSWAPDLYSSLALPITAYFTTVPKLALLAFLYSLASTYGSSMALVNTIASFSAICFIVGSIGLFGQWQIGRFIAYSAIVHLGYFLMAYSVLACNSFLFYGLVYSLALLNLFLAIIGSKDLCELLLAGIGSGQQPSLGSSGLNRGMLVAVAVTLFSLAAIPPFSGFFAKLAFLVLSLEIYWLSIIAVLASTLSAANYLFLATKLALFNLSSSKTPLLVIAPLTAYLISAITLLLTFASPLAYA